MPLNPRPQSTSTMPGIFPLRSQLHPLLRLFHFLLLLHQHIPVTGQSFAELASVKFGGIDGAGSILPYSSSSQAAGGSGVPVDPNILNIIPKVPGGSNQDTGPVYVGPTYTNGTESGQSGPVFHNIFGGTPGILGPSQVPGRPDERPPQWPYPGGTQNASGSGGSSSGSGPPTWPNTGDSGRHAGGGGRLVDPPNRSSLWREKVPGAVVNRNDHQLNCGAEHIPMLNPDVEEARCGVCGDSPIGVQDHMIGGRYVGFRPYVSRTYSAGGVMPVTFTLNHAVIPGVDRVTFALCQSGRRWLDVARDCLTDGRGVQIVGWGEAYLPIRPGVHRVYLRLPPSFSCLRCVLQWRWQSSHVADKQRCSRQPWLRACYRPVTYVNCADVAITRPFINSITQFMLLAQDNL